MRNLTKVIYPELSYKINGALFSVHNRLGRFRNEQQYADAVAKELEELGIPFEREKTLPVSFEGETRGRNKVDFLVAQKIVLEIKAKRTLLREDYYQTKRYLSALHNKLGLLVNFRDKYLHPKRILNSSARE